MPKIWLTSDTHFSHRNIIKYCDRPFTSVEEMDKAMTDNWNSVVSKEDTVYHLGDFALPDRRIYTTQNDQDQRVENIIQSLNGNIIIVFGSHDKQAFNNRHTFSYYYFKNTIVDLNINGVNVIMGHCPMLSWEKRTHGSIHFFGHVHSGPRAPFLCQQNSYDCGVDNNEFKPILFEEAVQKAMSLDGKLTCIDRYDNIVRP